MRDQQRRPSEPQAYRVPLGKRLARFATLIGALFAVTAGVIVTQKLSQDALALMIGLTCGLAAIVPTLALGVFIWHRERTQVHTERLQDQPPSYQNPPVIVVTPQALPSQHGTRYQNGGYGGDQAWMPGRNQRQFTIVGQED
jgi:hypothetical protein